VLCAPPAVAALLVAFFVTWATSFLALAVVVGVVAALACWALAWRLAPALALGLTGAVEAGPADQPRVHNLLDGLCMAMGLVKPCVFVLADPRPNAMTVGVDPRRTYLVLTTGLLTDLSRLELEGVLAHELSHVRSGDIIPATAAVAGLGPVAALVPAAGRWLGRARGRGREGLADLAAVRVTRYPPGLAVGLAKVEAGAGREPLLPGVRGRLTGHLWLAWPGGDLAARVEILEDQ
jgi:heat shock protein HtpX